MTGLFGIPGAVIAVLLIVADVVLRVTGHDAQVFDQTVPVVAAVYLGGQVATHALMANKTTVTTSENGKTTTTNGHS